MSKERVVLYLTFALAFFVTVLCAGFGVILVFKGVSGQTQIQAFGWTISTAIGGLAALFIGVGAAVWMVTTIVRHKSLTLPPNQVAYGIYLFVALDELHSLIEHFHQVTNGIRNEDDLKTKHGSRTGELVDLDMAAKRFARALWLGHASRQYGQTLDKIKTKLDDSYKMVESQTIRLRHVIGTMSNGDADEAQYSAVFENTVNELNRIADELRSIHHLGTQELQSFNGNAGASQT